MRLPFRFYQGHRASSVLKAVVANEVSIGALDRVENGGTLVADKFKSNGVLINRGNGQLVIGIVAKVSYLKKHLGVAKEMYDAGETLPEAVIEALRSAGMISAEDVASEAAVMMLSLDDRALPDEEDEAAPFSADEGEGEAPAADESSEASETAETSSASETNAPVRTIEDLIRESRERAAREAARVHRTIPTTIGALTSAARGAASQTMASIESRADAAVTALWADAGYGKSDFDAYRTERSGMLFGVQGSTETVTLGAACGYRQCQERQFCFSRLERRWRLGIRCLSLRSCGSHGLGFVLTS